MKVAIVGSRGLEVRDFSPFLPKDTCEIISGGAKGIDSCAAEYAKKCGIALTEIKPDYKRYSRGAPLMRNKEIVKMADFVLIFWDEKSRGTKFVIDECEKTDTQYSLHIMK